MRLTCGVEGPKAPGFRRWLWRSICSPISNRRLDSSYLQSSGGIVTIVEEATGVETVFAGDKTLAIILRGSFTAEGIRFFTPDAFSQQLAYMNRPAGYVIAPHVHNPVVREVEFTREVLFIRRGRARVDFYDEDRVYLGSQIVAGGDVLFLACGGHGFEMLESTEMIEVKQGPYVGEHDKTRFDPISPDQLRMY